MRLFKLTKCKRVNGLHFTPDGGRLLAVGGPEVRTAEAAAWLDLTTGEPVRRLDFFADVYAVSPDHRRLALATGAGVADELAYHVRWRDPWADGAGWQRLDLGGGSRVTNAAVALAFTPDGGRLIVEHDREHRPRGRQLSTSAYRTTVFRFDPTAVDSVVEVEDIFPVVAIAPDGRYAGTGGIDGDPTVALFDRPGGKELARLDPPGTQTRQLVFSPDGSRLAAVNGRRVFQLSSDRLEPVADPLDHPKQANAVAYTPDGRRLLTACHDAAVRVWEADGRMVRGFEWKVGPVTAVAVAPDGLTAAAAGRNGQVVLWDVDG